MSHLFDKSILFAIIQLVRSDEYSAKEGVRVSREFLAVKCGFIERLDNRASAGELAAKMEHHPRVFDEGRSRCEYLCVKT